MTNSDVDVDIDVEELDDEKAAALVAELLGRFSMDADARMDILAHLTTDEDVFTATVAQTARGIREEDVDVSSMHSVAIVAALEEDELWPGIQSRYSVSDSPADLLVLAEVLHSEVRYIRHAAATAVAGDDEGVEDVWDFEPTPERGFQ